MRGLLFALLALALALPASAQPRRPRVRIATEGLFGDGTLLAGGWAPVAVRLSNLTDADLSGVARVEVRGYEGATMRHEAVVDLPARAERAVVVTVLAPSSGSDVVATYRVDDRELASDAAGIDYAPGGYSVVVLGDPPRLRQALHDLDIEADAGGRHRQVRVPVGTVAFDPATGDPRLPEVGAAWSTVRVLVASAPLLERAGEAQRAAIGDWVRGGGRLLVFPRTDNDVARPWLRDLVGPLEVGVSRERGGALVPDDVRRFGLACAEAQRTESFGCSATVGFGRVYVTDYDGMGESAITSGVPRELVRSVYAGTLPLAPALAPGRGTDEGFGRTRRALDPNEGFRPALGLVAVVLLLYVIFVGPLNFRWVQRRNAPALALATTPAAAVLCFAVLLGVGYVGKGVLMRYRRVELIEAVEGEPRLLSRRYTGLFSTRPGGYDLPPLEGGIATRIGGRVAEGPTHRLGPRGVELADVRAALWQTVFLREDRVLELGGAVRFERDGRRLAQVVNETSVALEAAFVLDPAGALYAVGPVPAGGRAEIQREAYQHVGSRFSSSGSEWDVDTVGAALGVGEDERPYLEGVIDLVGSAFVPERLPVLYARAAARPETIAGLFGVEADTRFVRIVPRMRGAALSPAPAPLETNEWGEPVYRQEEAVDETIAEVLEGLDAGASPAADAGVSEPGVGESGAEGGAR